MCDVPTGLTILAGVTGFIGDSKAAAAQEAANEQSRALAIRNQKLQIQALQNQSTEDTKRATDAQLDNQRAAEALRATAIVSAGEAGVSGLSVDALIGDLIRQESENKQDILSTNQFQQKQRDLERQGIGITTQSQINQLPLVNYPSFTEAALTTAASGYNTYDIGRTRRAQRDKK